MFLRGNTQSLDASLDKSGKKLKDLKEAAKPAGVGALGGALSSALGSFTSALPGGSSASGMLGGMMGGGSGATSMLGMLAGGFAGLAAGVVGATVALVGFGLAQMSVIGTTARMANLLGLSTGSLQALEHQANMSGVSAEELHHNLMKMEEGISDSSSKASKALSEMGISQAGFKDKSTLDQFTQIEQKMRAINNQGDRLRLAKELWGKSGASMAAMFDPAKHTLQEAREEAEKLGLVLSQADTKQIQEANKAWKMMKSAITGIGNSIAVELAPVITDIASGLKDMVLSLRQFLGEMNVETPEWMRYIRAIPVVFQMGMATITFGLMKLFEGLVQLLAKIPGVGQSIKDFADATSAASADQFKTMEAKAKELDAILNPKNKPVVPGKSKPDPEPDKGKSKVETDTKNKAALAGSVDAFSIIAGDQKDKMFRTTNNILNENKRMAKALEKLVAKFAGGVKFIKKKI